MKNSLQTMCRIRRYVNFYRGTDFGNDLHYCQENKDILKCRLVTSQRNKRILFVMGVYLFYFVYYFVFILCVSFCFVNWSLKFLASDKISVLFLANASSLEELILIMQELAQGFVWNIARQNIFWNQALQVI